MPARKSRGNDLTQQQRAALQLLEELHQVKRDLMRLRLRAIAQRQRLEEHLE